MKSFVCNSQRCLPPNSGLSHLCVNYPDGVGGASDDWAKDHGIKYTATIEMRDTEEGYGFILPADQIIPNAEGMAS